MFYEYVKYKQNIIVLNKPVCLRFKDWFSPVNMFAGASLRHLVVAAGLPEK